MENKIEIFVTADNETEIKVQFDADTVWLNQSQMAELFDRDRSVITRHIYYITIFISHHIKYLLEHFLA